MRLKNTKSSYGAVAKCFHWLMAILIIGLIIVGFVMTDMQGSPDKFRLYGLHKSVGASILLLVLLRLIWKYKNISPELPDSLDSWQKLGAKANHWVLYGLMIAMPLSGWAMSSAAGFSVSVFGWFTLPDIVSADRELFLLFRQAHETIGYLIIITVLLHITAALLHHFYYGDNILSRMLPSFKKGFDEKSAD